MTQQPEVAKLTYFFGGGTAEGDASGEMVALLGNKGAQLQEMTNMGLPVPPGFTIPTGVCRDYFEHNGQLPDGLMEDVRADVGRLEQVTGKRFGDAENDPLLVSARSGADVSMPGMMETILNLGLNDEVVRAYMQRHGHDDGAARFILDCQRRQHEMFGENALGINKEEFRGLLDGLKEEVGVKDATQLSSSHLETLVHGYKQLYEEHGKEMPQDPFRQLEAAIRAVEESAMGKKARDYRRAEKLPEKVYTGVTVQAMVYGNKNRMSGTGVGFTRNPETGENVPYGEFLLGGQGEDVVGGGVNVNKLSAMEKHLPEAYAQLMKFFRLLETKKRRVQDIEFTVENGQLFMLQTRDAKMTGRARVRSGYDMAQEGLITEEEAVLRVTPNDLEQLLHPMIDYKAINASGLKLEDMLVTDKGVPASPGAGVGKAVFDVATALQYAERGEPFVLCRIETDPGDVAGGISPSQATLTARGGNTSHAATVARGKGIPCVVGTGLDINQKNKTIAYTNNNGEVVTVNEGDYLTVDGSAGKVFHCEAPLAQPNPNDRDLQNFLPWLRQAAKMRVYANANDAGEAARALQFGAEGIGLARTEYMFLEDKVEGENRALAIQSWVLAGEGSQVKSGALQKLEGMQRSDFLEMYGVMADKPVIVRLLDYPFHELLSGANDHLDALSQLTQIDKGMLEQRISSFHENNPMLGHRSVRLGITHPELCRMQARAILSAAKEYNDGSGGGYVTPHIEIPLVSMQTEVEYVANMVKEEAGKLGFSRGGFSSEGDNRYLLGVMFELAGASFMAAELAQVSDFGSFGTNDLTQTTMGWSREDGNETFMPVYVEKGIVKADPFVTIDKEGSVARAMAHAVLLARSVKPDFEIGICGAHAADPESLKVCFGMRLNNVSPSPNQVPIAWLISAQQSMAKKPGGMLEEYASETANRLLDAAAEQKF